MLRRCKKDTRNTRSINLITILQLAINRVRRGKGNNGPGRRKRPHPSSTPLPSLRDGISHLVVGETVITSFCCLSPYKLIQCCWLQSLIDNSRKVGRHFPDAVGKIERKLVQGIVDPAFDKPDLIIERSGHDYAYDALWLLVVGGGIEGD